MTTSTSRFRAHAVSRASRSAVHIGLFLGWHALCTGCVYWKPTYTGNDLPDLLSVDPPMDQPVQLDRDVIEFTVLSLDPEGASLESFWRLPAFAVGSSDGDESGGVYYDFFDLQVGPGLDGSTLSLIITDVGEDDPVVLTVDWALEAP